MYTQQDKLEIRQSIVKYAVILAVLAAAVLAVYVVGIVKGVQWIVQASGLVLYGVFCYMWFMYLWPCIRYSVFLKDMDTGLSREVCGSIVEVAKEEELQDGVRVYPVRVLLEEEEDERIVYLNVSKAEMLPANGTKVRLSCFGRHIKEVAAA